MADENLNILPGVFDNSSSQRALNNTPEDDLIINGDDNLLCHKSDLRERSPVLDDLIDEALQNHGVSIELSTEHLSIQTMKVILAYMQSSTFQLQYKTMEIIRASDYLK